MVVVHYQQVDERNRMHKGVERELERVRLKQLQQEKQEQSKQ